MKIRLKVLTVEDSLQLAAGFFKWRGLLLVIILSAVWIHTAAASDRTLRCQGRLVGIGADIAEVLEKCGDPDKITRWEEGRNSTISKQYDYERERFQAPESVRGPILFERWTYDFGANMLLRHLIFENGKLIGIETGERGTD